jgi:anti-sigma B factor antagonist
MSGEPGHEAFSVHTQAAARTYVVTPLGELDLLTVKQLQEALDARPGDCELLVLDLRGLTFFDTTGMRLVVDTMQRADAESLGFALIRGSRAVQRLFALARLEDRLPFLDDPEQAVGR